MAFSLDSKMFSSARLACVDVESDSVYIETLLIPSLAHALIHRTAISPRLAIKTFLMFEIEITMLKD